MSKPIEEWSANDREITALLNEAFETSMVIEETRQDQLDSIKKLMYTQTEMLALIAKLINDLQFSYQLNNDID